MQRRMPPLLAASACPTDGASRAHPRTAFSLIELLVVVAIISVLVSILSPTIKRARWLTVTTVCAAHQSAFVTAVNAYANEHGGYLPRQDIYGMSTGQNMWDVNPEFYYILRDDYGLAHEMFFCPEVSASGGCEEWGGDDWWFVTNRTRSRAEKWPDTWRQEKQDNFFRIGYNWWVPRINGKTVLVPDEFGDGDFSDVLIRGPISAIRDPVAAGNILLSDFASSRPEFDDVDLSQVANSEVQHYDNHHLFLDRLELCNQAWADGHVERIGGAKLRPVYFGNFWNWK